MGVEQRTARLTVLIDPDKKALFEELCARDDQTPSQVVRRLIRDYIEQKLGQPWTPGQTAATVLGRRRGRGG
ncbi:ribbon-helix-helix protein, CopG family [Fontimonas sp. SYSU GA230001]|uniref:ribbon-helix-helix protein, CopG family n=1 Tax=Fontimonas sp. SYSU GA230001 TaxID=3142450 RepID=UPI0032B40932